MSTDMPIRRRLLGTSLNWGGSTFTLGAAGIADAVSSTTIALPAGNDSTLNILATASTAPRPVRASSSPTPTAPPRPSSRI